MSSIGLISCSSLKLPVPAPAWLLYSRSPRFCQQYQALKEIVDQVLILSAKYGLLEPERVIAPYNEKMTLQRALELRPSVEERLSDVEVFSLLPTIYRKAVVSSRVIDLTEGKGSYQLSAKLGKRGKLIRGDIKVCWPIEKVLLWIYSKPRTVEELQSLLRKERYSEATVKAQTFRAIRCPLHSVENGIIRSRYVPAGERV